LFGVFSDNFNRVKRIYIFNAPDELRGGKYSEARARALDVVVQLKRARDEVDKHFYLLIAEKHLAEVIENKSSEEGTDYC